eukprot:6066372-Prymnesium_polylepis.1
MADAAACSTTDLSEAFGCTYSRWVSPSGKRTRRSQLSDACTMPDGADEVRPSKRGLGAGRGGE